MKQRKDLEAANQSGHFWEVEDPEIMDTGRNVLRYYPEAQRLVIHLPDWENYKTGKLCPGKGVGLNLYALAESRLNSSLYSLLMFFPIFFGSANS